MRERDERTKRGPTKAREEEAVSIEKKKMKGRQSMRTEGRTECASGKRKSLTKRAKRGCGKREKERKKEQEELEGLVG